MLKCEPFEPIETHMYFKSFVSNPFDWEMEKPRRESISVGAIHVDPISILSHTRNLKIPSL